MIPFAAVGIQSITFCDLVNTDRFVGRVNEITARLMFSMHGVVLSSELCRPRTEDVPLVFPHDGAPDVEFDLDPEAMTMLQPFFRPTGGVASTCAVITGQLFVKRDFRSKREAGGRQGNGFGPRGAFRRAFVLQSVKRVFDCD